MAASPTYAECFTQLKNAIKWLELQYRIGSVTTDNLLGQEDTILQALEGRTLTIKQALDAMANCRGSAATALRLAPTLLQPFIFNFATVIGADPREGIQTFITRLYTYMVANSKTINSRDFVRGSWTDGSPSVGTGTINRLTTDADGYAIENSFADVITAEVVSDQNSGTKKGQEIFEFRGGEAGEDELELEISGRGSGLVVPIACKSSDDSPLINASFADYSGTAAVPTEITGWTPTTIGDYDIDTTNYYRAGTKESTPAALVFTATDNIYQRISTQGTTLDPFTPYYLQIAWNRQVNSATGDLTLHLGAQSTVVTAAAQTGWQILRLAIGTKNWFKNFNEDSLDINIDWVSTGGTGMIVDDVVFAPYTAYDGCWVCPVGGATPFLRRDIGTFTDTETGAIIQRWMWRAFTRFLPGATAGGETEADPTISL